ncbi:hypothetical protein KSS87_010372 [Heliosperma pusillum]|nr:hypothetical protein KSS87_010372 [Heliosperma pusillum]
MIGCEAILMRRSSNFTFSDRNLRNGVVLQFARLNFGGVKLRASILDSSSPDDSNFAKRTEKACNLLPFHALRATQKDMLNANGVLVLASSSSEIICFVKFHLKTLPVSYAWERDQLAARIVKELDFAQSGFSIDEWELTRLQTAQMSTKLLHTYQLTNPNRSTSPKSATGRPIEAAPGFVRLRKDLQTTSVRCVMNDTSLHKGAVGVAFKDALVIVDHGSRRQQSNLLLNEFVMMFKNKTGYAIVEPAHMELAEPSIRDAFGSCVQQGASRVIISPFFLFPGRHWHQDIPLLAEAAASEYPGIPYLVTAPLGLHHLLVDVMKERIDYCLSHVDGKVDECAVCAGTGKLGKSGHSFTIVYDCLVIISDQAFSQVHKLLLRINETAEIDYGLRLKSFMYAFVIGGCTMLRRFSCLAFLPHYRLNLDWHLTMKYESN